jgi:hypothetical protein
MTEAAPGVAEEAELADSISVAFLLLESPTPWSARRSCLLVTLAGDVGVDGEVGDDLPGQVGGGLDDAIGDEVGHDVLPGVQVSVGDPRRSPVSCSRATRATGRRSPPPPSGPRW